MRLRRAAVALGCAGLALPVIPAYAESSTVCTVSDDRIAEGSGLVAVADGYRIANDGGDQASVYRLDAGCVVTGTTSAAVDPYDVEDLAIGPDGALWLADIGDNSTSRASVAVIVMPDRSGPVSAVLRRLQYPDGPHDAESMIVDDAGRAIIMTKTLSGLVGIYRSGPVDLSPGGEEGPQPLEKVAEIQLKQTGTAGGPLGPPLSNLMSTGAARCGDLVALRTYTDAYVWQAHDPSSLAVSQASWVPLPSQSQGEAISFTSDCAALLVHGEGVGVPLQRVALPEAQASANAPVAGGEDAVRNDEQDARMRILLILGGSLVVAVVVAVLSRRRRRTSRLG